MKNSSPMKVLETPSREERGVQSEPLQHASEVRLQDLIPIAMVIVGGCEPCAESMVNRALKQAVRGKTSIRLCASSQVRRHSNALPRPSGQTS